MRALGEDGRTRRRTIGDALEVVRQQLGLDEIERAEIKIGQLFQLPYGESRPSSWSLSPISPATSPCPALAALWRFPRRVRSAKCSKFLASMRPEYVPMVPLCSGTEAGYAPSRFYQPT